MRCVNVQSQRRGLPSFDALGLLQRCKVQGARAWASPDVLAWCCCGSPCSVPVPCGSRCARHHRCPEDLGLSRTPTRDGCGVQTANAGWHDQRDYSTETPLAKQKREKPPSRFCPSRPLLDVAGCCWLGWRADPGACCCLVLGQFRIPDSGFRRRLEATAMVGCLGCAARASRSCLSFSSRASCTV